jgi:hypothetical protein
MLITRKLVITTHCVDNELENTFISLKRSFACPFPQHLEYDKEKPVNNIVRCNNKYEERIKWEGQ